MQPPSVSLKIISFVPVHYRIGIISDPTCNDGIRCERTVPGLPAAYYDIRPGDVVTRINSLSFTSTFAHNRTAITAEMRRCVRLKRMVTVHVAAG